MYDGVYGCVCDWFGACVMCVYMCCLLRACILLHAWRMSILVCIGVVGLFCVCEWVCICGCDGDGDYECGKC